MKLKLFTVTIFLLNLHFISATGKNTHEVIYLIESKKYCLLDSIPCSDPTYNNYCITDCMYKPDSIFDFKMKLKWASDTYANQRAVSNILVDGQNNKIYSIYSRRSNIVEEGLFTFDLGTGKSEHKIIIDTSIYGVNSHLLVYSLNGNLNFVKWFDNSLVTYSHVNFDINGNRHWVDTNDIYNKFPNIADFNGDNLPEIYAGNTIYNANTGKVLLKGSNGEGCNSWSGTFNPCNGSRQCIAADLTDADGLELACGNTVYELDITNPDSMLGNTISPIIAPPSVNDGYTAVADIDLDGELDVIVVKSKEYNGGIWVWNPRNETIIAQARPGLNGGSPGTGGGLPAIADLDGDCYPEIVIAFRYKLNIYKYDGTTQLQLFKSIGTSDESAVTSPTLFDFNQDGMYEIIYRDETELRIFDGNADLISSFPLESGTLNEYPIVTDVDNDGQAEILVNGSLPTEEDSCRIFCFESAGSPWAPARKSWNQSGYNISNVNDDLSIPSVPENPAKFYNTTECHGDNCSQPYNTFLCQATYRDQNGCPVWPAVDMVLDIFDYECIGDSIRLAIELRNQSENSFKQDSVNLGLYKNEEDNLLTFISRTWEKGQSLDTVFITLATTDLDKVKGRINIPNAATSFTDDIHGQTNVLECDYDNNWDSLEIDLSIQSLDLGPDITKCESEEITLSTEGAFEQFLWSDQSTDSVYTTREEGIHHLEAMDGCGRVYRDTVVITIDHSNDVNLGGDLSICPTQSEEISLSGDYDQVDWLPADVVDCDTCQTVTITSDTSFMLIAIGQKDNCISSDTILVDYLQEVVLRDSATICEGDEFMIQDTLLRTSGNYTFHLNNCDSTFVLNLSVIPKDVQLDSATLCRGDSLAFGGMWIKEEGTYPHAFATNANCDSLVELMVKIVDGHSHIEEARICEGDSILIFGMWQKDEGIYEENLSSIHGCDSLIQVNLQYFPNYDIFDTITICEGDSIEIANQWLKEEGMTTIPLQSIHGCDSTYNVLVQIGDVFIKDEAITLCEGDSVLIDNNWVKEEGSYPVSFQNNSGCDSLITYQVQVQQITMNFDTIDMCQGDSVLINNRWIKAGGMYMDTVALGECYKIDATLIQEILIEQTLTQFTLCPNDSIQINGTWLKESGEYDFMMTSSLGCDSILIAEITLLDQPNEPEVYIDCESLEILAEISNANSWDILWDNGQQGEFATYTQSGIGSVSLTSAAECEVVYEFDLPEIPNDPPTTILKDTLVSQGSVVAINLDLNPEKWHINWQSNLNIACDSCHQITLLASSTETVTLSLTHLASGCYYETTFMVKIKEEDLNIPNVFSPNNDGDNDVWSLDLSSYQNPKVKIYDRWGNLIFQSTDQLPVWDGKFNGQNALPGVYVYTIQYESDGKVQSRQGDLTVLR